MPERYRKFAIECLEWAKLARTELERRDFLDMAEASMRAAAEYGGVPSWVGQPAASPEDNRSDPAPGSPFDSRHRCLKE